MMYINIRTFLCVLLLGITTTMFYGYGDNWTKRDPVCNLINDALFGEEILWIDVDQFDNLWALSRIHKTKEIFLSVNGKKVWQSSKAKDGEPKDIESFSCKSVKNWSMGLTDNNTRFVLKSLDGMIWAVTKSENLYKLVKGSDGSYEWQKDDGITKVNNVFSGIDGDTWALTEKEGSGDQVYHLNNGTWEAIPGKEIFFLAVSDKDHVWSINKARKVSIWDASTKDWKYVYNATAAKNIASGPTGNLWDVVLLGTTFIKTDKKWVSMGGLNVHMVAVGRTRTYSITHTIALQAGRKFQFQFIPSDLIWEVHVRPSEIVYKKGKSGKAKGKKEETKKVKVQDKKAKKETPEPVEQEPVAQEAVAQEGDEQEATTQAATIEAQEATTPAATTEAQEATTTAAPEATSQEATKPVITK